MTVSTKETASAPIRFVDPHRRLMAAVLQTVIDDCHGTAYRRAAHPDAPIALRGVRQAIIYVASTDRSWPFSFENLCEALGMDAGCVRQQLQRRDQWNDSDEQVLATI